MTNWGLLREAIGGELVLAGSPGYESARQPVLDRYKKCRPRAVVFASQTSDVVAAIGFARRHELRTSARSGGHCFAGRSSMGDVIIDVTPINAVSIVDGVATVGAGARLGDLYAALAIQGRTLPSGSEPSVGIVGITLGGGLGMLGRMHGLTCDHLLSAQVVLADGRVVECDHTHDSDLFWALRGAGGGQFGVVTSLTFRTVPAQGCTIFCIAWPHVQAAAVVEAWQGWAPGAPDALDANLRLSPAAVVLFGAMTGTTSETEALLDDFIAMVGAAPYRTFGRPQAAAGHMFSKSEFFRQPLPRKAIDALLGEFLGGSGPARELNFTPWGGAYNRVPSDATAFAHRAELFMIEHVVTVAATASMAERDEARAWLARSWASVHPWGSGGVYPNFPDPDLETGTEAYHGANYARLLRVKRLYDPGDWFRFPQSIAS